MPTKRSRMEQIEARAKAAEPGPWTTKICGNGPPHVVNAGDFDRVASTDENCTFTAHAREDIPWLLDRVRELQEENKRLWEVNMGLRDALRGYQALLDMELSHQEIRERREQIAEKFGLRQALKEDRQ